MKTPGSIHWKAKATITALLVVFGFLPLTVKSQNFGDIVGALLSNISIDEASVQFGKKNSVRHSDHWPYFTLPPVRYTIIENNDSPVMPGRKYWSETSPWLHPKTETSRILSVNLALHKQSNFPVLLPETKPVLLPSKARLDAFYRKCRER
jgi:hypothetical protein